MGIYTMDQQTISDSKSQIKDLHESNGLHEIISTVVKKELENAFKEYVIVGSKHLERIERICTVNIDPNYNKYTKNPNSINEQGENWIMYACYKSNHSFLKLILEDKLCDINLQNINGYTALHVAINSESIKCFELLINHGCDINISSNRGITPLMLACIKANFQIFSIIYKHHDCTINNKDKDGRNELYNTLSNYNHEIASSLVRNMKYKINDIIDSNENTALMLACDFAHSAIAIKIINRMDCKRNLVNKNKQTALMIACKNKLYDIIKEFLEYDDCGYDFVDNKNKTVLDYIGNIIDVPINQICWFKLLKQKVNAVERSKKIHKELLEARQNKKKYVSIFQLVKNITSNNGYKPKSQPSKAQYAPLSQPSRAPIEARYVPVSQSEDEIIEL
jgi:ankyrin repeat protein